jgi:predicted ATPase
MGNISKTYQGKLMIYQIKFKKRFRCFEENETVEFRPGVNLLVGDQGCGKSSLLLALKEDKKTCDIVVEPGSFGFFDFEKDNPRTLPYFGKDIQFQVSSMYSSHGQSVRALLSGLSKITNQKVVMLDEPDSACSPRTAYWLADILAKSAKTMQIIASIHNPIIIESFPEVLSLEHRRWMSSKEFLETQKEPLNNKESLDNKE